MRMILNQGGVGFFGFARVLYSHDDSNKFLNFFLMMNHKNLLIFLRRWVGHPLLHITHNHFNPSILQTMLQEILSAYSALGIKYILPSIKNHYIYERMGLPASLHQSLLAALEAPTSSTDGGFGTLAKVNINKTIREVDCLSIDPTIYAQMAEAFTSTVSTLTKSLLGLDATPCSAYGIFRYNSPTGHYISHCDAGTFDIHTKHLQIDYPCRHISFVYYPHANFTGGGLELSPIGDPPIMIVPQPDFFTLFPSDVRYPHKVYPTETGTRVAIVNWFSLHGQTDGTAHEHAGLPIPT